MANVGTKPQTPVVCTMAVVQSGNQNSTERITNGTNDDVEAQYYVTFKRRSPGHGCDHEIRRTIMYEESTSFHKEIKVDNAWVVPCNPHILEMFSFHINLEICIYREGAIKYLFKYVCNGPDRLTIYIKAKNKAVYDEVKNYQACCYIGAPEVVYKLLEYDKIEEKKTVESLKVHMPYRKEVCFTEVQE